MPRKPLTEVPPSDAPPMYCKEPGCSEDAFAKGYCNRHYVAKFKVKGNKEESGGDSPIVPPPKITRDDVEGMIVASMQMLSFTLDESFTAADLQKDKEGNDVPVVRPHVKQAVDEMMPWMKIYGASFVKLFPWFGLASGCIALAMPAIDPCIEIAAGVRKPRLFRKNKDDIYSDQWKMVLKRQQIEADARKKSEESASGKSPQLVIAPNNQPTG